MCNYEKTKELLNSELDKIGVQLDANMENAKNKFEKLIKSLLPLDKVSASLRFDTSTSSYERLATFGISQVGENGKDEFYGSISGNIYKDRIKLSLSIGMGGEEKIEQLERNRIYLCVKLYDNERKIIDLVSSLYDNYKAIHDEWSKYFKELEDIKYQEQQEERQKKLDEFNKKLKVGKHLVSLWLDETWNNLIERKMIYIVKTSIDYTIQKITDKTVIVQQYGWKNSHIKKDDAYNKLNKYLVSSDGNRFNLSEEQIERLKDYVKATKIVNAFYDIKEQQLYVWDEVDDEIKELKPDFKDNEMLKLFYVLDGRKYYLEEYECLTKEDK